jgi:uncharacterized protein YdeI (YjbR/CyaY-like superfamily)
VNVKRARELIEMGRMHPAGIKAFEERVQERSGIYSYENQRRELADSYERKFRANKSAWEFFRAQPPGYQRTVGHWVMSAKKRRGRSGWPHSSKTRRTGAGSHRWRGHGGQRDV